MKSQSHKDKIVVVGTGNVGEGYCIHPDGACTGK